MLLVKTNVEASTIHGLGLFAAQFIAKGTPIWKFTPGLDIKLTEEEFLQLPPLAQESVEHYCYRSVVDRTYVLVFDDARFFNHSKTPNVTSVDTPDESEGMEVALHDIKEGEELLCDCREFDADCRDGKEAYARN